MMPNDHFKDFYITKEFSQELLWGVLFAIPLKVICVLTFVTTEAFIFLVRYKTKIGRKVARGHTLTLKRDLWK